MKVTETPNTNVISEVGVLGSSDYIRLFLEKDHHSSIAKKTTLNKENSYRIHRVVHMPYFPGSSQQYHHTALQ